MFFPIPVELPEEVNKRMQEQHSTGLITRILATITMVILAIGFPVVMFMDLVLQIASGDGSQPYLQAYVTNPVAILSFAFITVITIDYRIKERRILQEYLDLKNSQN